MALKPYLQLVRLPNVFTAAADSLASWLLVTGSFAGPRAWVPLVLASACTYAGGIALNDVFDAEVDRLERPSRPIPSGRVSLRTAAVLGAAFMAAGLAFAFASGTRYGWAVELVLIGCVLAYDGGVKRSALGPVVMGACRGLNFLLGMSAVSGLVGPRTGLAVLGYALFVTGVTWVSRSEVESGRWRNIVLGSALQNAAILALIVAGVSLSSRYEMPGWVIPGVLLLLAIGTAINRRTFQAIRQPEPPLIQRAVKFGILSLVWLHVGLLLAVRGPGAALAVSLLWIPAAYAGRWIYST
jgi:4-hydroxybenzoate polyprenyltransferase